MAHTLSMQDRTEHRSHPTRYRAAAALTFGIGVLALIDLGLLIAGLVPWSFPVALLAVGLLVSASMAIGFELAHGRYGVHAAPTTALDGLAHDLRSPLTTTRSLLQLVEDGSLGALTPEARDALGRASLAAGRLEAVLQHTLQPATGQPSNRHADLDRVLDQALAALHTRIEDSGAVVRRHPLPVVDGDPIALERALTNLVLNAIVHARPGDRPEIDVDAERVNGNWVVTVSDNGPGIPATLRETAFDPGIRGRASRQSPGFGLGLSTVRRLVEEQGGRAWIDPSEAGARVRLELPAA